MNNKLQLWNDFCSANNVIQSSVPLFELEGDHVVTFPYGKNKRSLLKRSSQMDSLVIREVNKVINDFNNGTEEYEGLIYMMFWKDNDNVLPLYIGKSEKYCKKGKNLSENIKVIETDQGKFCRWGYNYAYHIGDLSAVVCEGHPDNKKTDKYSKWSKVQFKSYPSDSPQLVKPTFFWISAWKNGSIGPWKEFGRTSLTFLEYLLIGLASEVFPDVLLKEEGVNRK